MSEQAKKRNWSSMMQLAISTSRGIALECVSLSRPRHYDLAVIRRQMSATRLQVALKEGMKAK
ncbi:unnamed protein product, partial [Ceratitis capitata]